MGRMIKSMLFGLLLGTVVGIFMFPGLDRKTQKNIRRAKKKAMCMADDYCDNLMCYRNK